MAVNKDGVAYVVDSGHNRIVAFNKKGKYLFAFGEHGSKNGQFKHPVGITIDGSNQVYIADKNNSRIQIFDAKGQWLKSIPVERSSRSLMPVDVAVNPNNNQILATINNTHEILRYSQDGRLLGTWGGEGVDKGKFRYPATMAISGKGQIYVVDVLNTRVQVFSSTGESLVNVGQWGILSGEFFRPKGVALDLEGNVYVGDSFMDVIQVFDSSHRFLYVLGKRDKPRRFVSVAGIAVDNDQRLYAVEMLEHRVSVYSLEK
ncbi:MAG: NHL repeat-containing protein [Gammaproteobacteria bacterium]|nr:NHL repeat-containing protein [Gammaproteobacteria bacterium]